MNTMQKGTIYSADLDGHFVLKMVGDVRLTLCSALDHHIEQMLCDGGIKEVTVDLTDTQGIDSTSLGLVAKLGMRAKRHDMPTPVLVSPNDDITKIIITMGFEHLFVIDNEENPELNLPLVASADPSVDAVTQVGDQTPVLTELPEVNESLSDIHKRILTAHKVLSELSDSNRAAFKDLVASLEACCVEDETVSH